MGSGVNARWSRHARDCSGLVKENPSRPFAWRTLLHVSDEMMPRLTSGARLIRTTRLPIVLQDMLA
jgi:hypothetical protein